MARLRQKVITIHGVNPDRNWPIAAKAVLQPHFDVVGIDYRGYDGVQGPIRVVCHPLALVTAVVMLLVAALVGASGDTTTAANLSGGALGIFLLGLLAAAIQRHWWARRIKKQLSALCISPPPPHLIAHSFGTYLTGRALRHPDLSMDRINLVGSVLPRRYDWDVLVAGGRRAFRQVRNEVGTKDFAVMAAGKARWLAWDVGDSGLRGFVGSRVHSIGGPWANCAICGSPGMPDGSVHNVTLSEMGHSDVFLGPGHARRLWLPFFWGYSPSEFDLFVSLCWDAAFYLQEGFSWKFDVIVAELADKEWEWTGDKSLREFIASVIEHELRSRAPGRAHSDFNKLTEEALGALCNYVARAAGDAPVSEKVRRTLYPLTAVMESVRSSLGV